MVIVVALLLRVGNSIFNREELLGRAIDAIDLKGLLRKLWRYIRSVDARGTVARSFGEWLRRGVPLSLRNIRRAMLASTVVFIAAFAVGIVYGYTGPWQLNLPRDLDLREIVRNVDATAGLFLDGLDLRFILLQNMRVLALASLLGVFTFGAGTLLITPIVYVVLGYLVAQVAIAGYNPLLLLPAILTHGIIEIPVILIATAAAVRLGAVVTRPPRDNTVGHAWIVAFTDAVKLWLAIVLPGLLLAALIESYLTTPVTLYFLTR
jgi:stage II sporulation protein M